MLESVQYEDITGFEIEGNIIIFDLYKRVVETDREGNAHPNIYLYISHLQKLKPIPLLCPNCLAGQSP